MYAKVYSATLVGLQGRLIEVEADVLNGLSSFSIVGLPDQSINESKERIALAIRSIKAKPPLKFNKKTIVNLAPADLKKEGPILDLAVAVSFLIASGQLIKPKKKILFLAELGLNGRLRKVKGALPIILSLTKENFDEIHLPQENYEEVKYLKNQPIFLFNNLQDLIAHLENRQIEEPLQAEEFKPEPDETDFSFLKIPEHILRALIIAAGGKHNLLLHGPPGTGKTLIAQNIVSLLPGLTYAEAIEVSSVQSAIGQFDQFKTRPPFRNPHHSASAIAILGGGQTPKPGEISLAHHGVLFFDELPEFHRDVLEGLREPLETNEITVSRSKQTLKFPARFIFIGAYNPCPCGFYDDPEKECVCSAAEIRRYRKKISGPLLDRMDIFLNIPRQKSAEIFKENKINVARTKTLINDLRLKQEERQGKANAELKPKELKEFCLLEPASQTLLETAADRLRLSLRGIHKILKISRTIADLDQTETIAPAAVAEATQYRFQNDGQT